MAVSKRMKAAYEGLNQLDEVTLAEAVKIIKNRSKVKFDESVEVSMNLNVDTRKADQSIRGMVGLPHGTGKNLRVAVICKDDKIKEAKDAGADFAGSDELAEMIQKGDINFDRCIATPDMMVLVGKLGKILGPKGLMPNPKLGTVTPNVAEAVKAAKGGQVEYRAEKAGIIHGGVGKVSFTEAQLVDNIKAFAGAVVKARPAGIKGSYVKKMTLSSSMGPSIRVLVNEVEA